MDRNFHTDDFERLLREKSDEFRMYPSKRIWHSIYNSIHPGRKWPSVAMSITLIATLLLIGYLNTNNPNSYSATDQKSDHRTLISQSSRNQYIFSRSSGDKDEKSIAHINAQTIPLAASTIRPGSTVGQNAQSQAFSLAAGSSILNIQQATPTEAISKPADLPVTAPSNSLGGQSALNQTAVSTVGITSERQTHGNKDLPVPTDHSSITAPLPNSVAGFNGELARVVIINNPTISIEKENTVPSKILEEATSTNITAKASLETKKPVITPDDMAWIDNYAMYNHPAPKKWASKLGWQLYVTPSVVYRVLLNHPEFNITQNTTPFVISPASIDINEEVIQTPSGGIEVGAGLQYFIFKGVKLKGGLQLNYTRYNSHAFHNTHPVVTKLTMYNLDMNSAYEVYRSTPYSNKNGLEAVKLHNETFQVSLPIGADFRLAGNERLQWNFGLSIQPTYLAGGKSYLISSDRRNYVKETSMLNRWNLNAGFETFITYQVNGLTFQVGPQFRSQLFSTNNKKFEVEEKIQNYGLKFGVSKTIR